MPRFPHDNGPILFPGRPFPGGFGKRFQFLAVFSVPDPARGHNPAVFLLFLTGNQQKNLVVDPVMVATSGARLISEDAIGTLKKELLPLAKVITPNIPEAEVLSGRTVASEKDMEAAAKEIYEKYGCGVLCKGGHSINDANDLLYDGKEMIWFKGKRINNPNTHGTGCTLSSAIASGLAKGYDLPTAVRSAKNYISCALAAMLDLGKGSGPMNHAFAIKGDFLSE